MAFTPFTSGGNSYQPKSSYQDRDIKQNAPGIYDKILGFQADWWNAYESGDQQGMDAAHQAAESLRAGFGYSGGQDGSQYLTNGYAGLYQQYQQAADASAYAYWLAAQQGANRLATQTPLINQQYDGLASQAYANYMLEKKALPETLSKLGLAGQGVAETSAVRQSNQYQQVVGQGELARQNALMGLQNKIDDLLAQGEYNAAKARADSALALAQQYPGYLAQQQKQENTKWEQDYRQKQLEIELDKDRGTGSGTAYQNGVQYGLARPGGSSQPIKLPDRTNPTKAPNRINAYRPMQLVSRR